MHGLEQEQAKTDVPRRVEAEERNVEEVERIREELAGAIERTDATAKDRGEPEAGSEEDAAGSEREAAMAASARELVRCLRFRSALPGPKSESDAESGDEKDTSQKDEHAGAIPPRVSR